MITYDQRYASTKKRQKTADMVDLARSFHRVHGSKTSSILAGLLGPESAPQVNAAIALIKFEGK